MSNGYWLRVYGVMEACASEFGRCTSNQAIRILAAIGDNAPVAPASVPLAPPEPAPCTSGPESGYDGYMARQHDGGFDGRMGGQ